jgi:hypothetical protein
MNGSVNKVDYFKVMVSNKKGEAAKILNAFQREGVDLLAFTGFPRGKKAQLDFVPKDSQQFVQAAKRSGVKVGRKKACFVIQGADKAGAMAEILSRLSGAKVDVIALDGLAAGEGRYGAILWVRPGDVAKTSKALQGI